MTVMAEPATRACIPVPPKWREALACRGVRLSAASPLRWWLLLAFFYGAALYGALKRVRDVLLSRMADAPGENYAVLMDLTTNMIPRGNTPGFDFVSWYLQSTARDGHIRQIWTHVAAGANASSIPSIVHTAHYLPRLEGLKIKLQFIGRLAWWIARSTLRGMIGRWWEIVLLEQAVDFVYARHLAKSQFARAYVFHNGRFIMRPLWTYAAEEAGAGVDLAFYGSNIETFGVTPSERRPVWPGYKGMTWQRYIVWDDFQAAFIRDLGLTAPAIVSGPIGLTDNAEISTDWPKPYVAVFDVTPHRSASLAIRGIPQPYYTARVWCDFMNQVQAALASNGFGMVYKKKREIGRFAAGASLAKLAALERLKSMFAVHPDAAPQRLIQDAAAVISMPFTSTALIAKAMGKPSMYYDPLGCLVGERRLAHGIDVIGTSKDLERWLAGLSCPARTGASTEAEPTLRRPGL
jgi:polysaccharide biosynthesis PFTS motif protein